MLASPAASSRRRRRRTGPHQRPPRRPATPRPRPPPLRRRRRAHRRPLPPVARPLGPPPPRPDCLPRGRAPFGRSGARPRPSPPARGFPPRHPRPRQASAQARPQGAPGRHRPRQLAAPRRRTARAGGARPRTPLRLNRRPPRPRLVLLRPRHLHPERIRCATHRLKVTLQRSVMKGGYPPPCLCESLNWRSQTVSLPALKEVDINGFKGEENGTDFLKLMLKCTPMLKGIIVKLSLEASASNDGCAKICNIFKAHSSVECDVYHSSGLMHNSQNCWRT